MRRLVLLRHGRTAWNDSGRAQGHTDVPLDEVGAAQAVEAEAAAEPVQDVVPGPEPVVEPAVEAELAAERSDEPASDAASTAPVQPNGKAKKNK